MKTKTCQHCKQPIENKPIRIPHGKFKGKNLYAYTHTECVEAYSKDRAETQRQLINSGYYKTGFNS